MIRNCIIQAVAFGIMCEFPKHTLKLSYILSNNIRLDLQLSNSGPIVTRTSLVAAVSVPELAWEPSLNSGLTALKVLCRGSLKGRLRGGPPRRLFLYSTQHLGKTSDFSWCAKPYGHCCMSIIKVAFSEQGNIRFAPSRSDATTMVATLL